MRETTETTAAFSPYLGCCLYISSWGLAAGLYDRRDDFSFPIVDFPFQGGDVPSAPAYGVCVSRLIRCARACSGCQDFVGRGWCSLRGCWAGGVRGPGWWQRLGGSMGDIMVWSIPKIWQFPELFLMFLPLTRRGWASGVPDMRFCRWFLRSGLWAWWAKLAYQVILTIHGRLITAFILGSMSVGLNILIRHLFTDL